MDDFVADDFTPEDDFTPDLDGASTAVAVAPPVDPRPGYDPENPLNEMAPGMTDSPPSPGFFSLGSPPPPRMVVQNFKGGNTTAAKEYLEKMGYEVHTRKDGEFSLRTRGQDQPWRQVEQTGWSWNPFEMFRDVRDVEGGILTAITSGLGGVKGGIPGAAGGGAAGEAMLQGIADISGVGSTPMQQAQAVGQEAALSAAGETIFRGGKYVLGEAGRAIGKRVLPSATARLLPEAGGPARRAAEAVRGATHGDRPKVPLPQSMAPEPGPPPEPTPMPEQTMAAPIEPAPAAPDMEIQALESIANPQEDIGALYPEGFDPPIKPKGIDPPVIDDPPIPETTVQKADAAAAQELESKTGADAVQVKVSELQTDPDTYQHKQGVDKRGLQKSVSDTHNPNLADNLHVHERLDGSRWVFNGHHRFARMEDQNVEWANAVIYKEADGWTIQKVRELGAIQNIRANTGTLRDYVVFFKESGMTYDEAKRSGILDTVKAENGFLLGRNGSDSLTALVYAEKIPDRVAALIARGSRGDEPLQDFAIRHFFEHRPPAEELENLVKAMGLSKRSKASAPKYKQTGIPGIPDVDSNAWDEDVLVGKKITQIQRDLKGLWRFYADGAKGKNAEALKKALGEDVLTMSTEEINVRFKALMEQTWAELSKWDHWDTDLELQNIARKQLGLPEFELPAAVAPPRPDEPDMFDLFGPAKPEAPSTPKVVAPPPILEAQSSLEVRALETLAGDTPPPPSMTPPDNLPAPEPKTRPILSGDHPVTPGHQAAIESAQQYRASRLAGIIGQEDTPFSLQKADELLSQVDDGPVTIRFTKNAGTKKAPVPAERWATGYVDHNPTTGETRARLPPGKRFLVGSEFKASLAGKTDQQILDDATAKGFRPEQTDAVSQLDSASAFLERKQPYYTPGRGSSKAIATKKGAPATGAIGELAKEYRLGRMAEIASPSDRLRAQSGEGYTHFGKDTITDIILPDGRHFAFRNGKPQLVQPQMLAQKPEEIIIQHALDDLSRGRATPQAPMMVEPPAIPTKTITSPKPEAPAPEAPPVPTGLLGVEAPAQPQIEDIWHTDKWPQLQPGVQHHGRSAFEPSEEGMQLAQPDELQRMFQGDRPVPPWPPGPPAPATNPIHAQPHLGEIWDTGQWPQLPTGIIKPGRPVPPPTNYKILEYLAGKGLQRTGQAIGAMGRPGRDISVTMSGGGRGLGGARVSLPLPGTPIGRVLASAGGAAGAAIGSSAAGWPGGAIGGAAGLATGAVAGKAISPAFRGAGNVMEGIGRFLQRDSGTYMKQISEIAPQRVANLAKATLMSLARGDGAYRAAVYIFVHQPEVQEWLHSNLQDQAQ